MIRSKKKSLKSPVTPNHKSIGSSYAIESIQKRWGKTGFIPDKRKTRFKEPTPPRVQEVTWQPLGLQLLFVRANEGLIPKIFATVIFRSFKITTPQQEVV